MPRVIHFELAADDPMRAQKFYGEVFGWHFQKYPGPMEYWLVSTGEDGPGIDGGLGKRMGAPTDSANTLDVPSVDEYVQKVTAAGGRVVQPKMAIPHVGWLAYCADSEGNVFGMMQADPTAS